MGAVEDWREEVVGADWREVEVVVVVEQVHQEGQE